MRIQLNGELKDVNEGLNIMQLLNSLQINRYTVVVERNEAIIRRAELDKTPVSEGDKIEIVRVLGGGSCR